MQDNKDQKYGMDLLRKAEAKRVGENLTKREMTTAFNMHYTYYWNCLNGKNDPSESLITSLEEYVNTPTDKVYERVFAMRRKEEGSRRITWDEEGREVPTEKLGLTKQDIDNILKDLEKDGLYKEPKL